MLSLPFQFRWNFLPSLRFHLICPRRLRHALKHVHESKELEVGDICREPCQIPCNPEASKGYSVCCLSADAYDAYNPKRIAEMFTEKENNIYSTRLPCCSLMDLHSSHLHLQLSSPFHKFVNSSTSSISYFVPSASRASLSIALA